MPTCKIHDASLKNKCRKKTGHFDGNNVTSMKKFNRLKCTF